MQDGRHPAFVVRVHKGVDEADGDRLRTMPQELPNGVPDFVLVEWGDHLAFAVHALGDLAAQIARGQRRFGHFQENVIDVVALLAADLQDIAEASRRDQAGFCPLALDEGIGHQRRAVDHRAHRLGREPLFAEECRDPFEGCPGWVIGRGQQLEDLEPPRRVIDHDDVGKGATDVYPATQPMTLRHRVLPHAWCRSPARFFGSKGLNLAPLSTFTSSMPVIQRHSA